jgi:hypothetical protein
MQYAETFKLVSQSLDLVFRMTDLIVPNVEGE